MKLSIEFVASKIVFMSDRSLFADAWSCIEKVVFRPGGLLVGRGRSNQTPLPLGSSDHLETQGVLYKQSLSQVLGTWR